MKLYDILIIGAGPVGLYTAFYAGMRQVKTLVIDSLEMVGGQPAHLYPEKFLYDIPAHPKLSGKELTQYLEKQVQRFPLDWRLGEEVVQVEEQVNHNDPESTKIFQVTTSMGQYHARSIIIAAGNGAFQPRKLNLDNAEKYEGKQLHYAITDLQAFKNRRVVVCGGGDSALDWALSLENVAKEVHLIHRRDQYRAMEHTVQELNQSSIIQHLSTQVLELIDKDDNLDAILLQKKGQEEDSTIELDDLVVCYGFSSSMGPIKNWGLEIQRQYLKVDRDQATNIPGIFAVGDICEYPGKVRIIASGFGEGPVAVNSALKHIDPNYRVSPVHSSSLLEGAE